MAVNIAIFASGRGSNARKIIEYFNDQRGISVALILANRPDAKVLDLGPENGIPTLVLQRKAFYEHRTLLKELKDLQIDYIILAGFLWLIPDYLVRAFPRRILNIHPALLPKYGGKGMYGIHVHRAVAQAGEEESGITIHYVNERYDEGAIIYQATCALNPADEPEDIAKKVLKLEHHYYPRVIHQVIKEQQSKAATSEVS